MSSSPSNATLTEFEAEVIEFFVGMTQLIGLPKSVGQIYGLIYASPTPLNLEGIIAHLGISRGSASQGLGFLRSTGAIQAAEVPESRSEHYIAETSLRSLVSGALEERIEPHLRQVEEPLDRLKELANNPDMEHSELMKERIARLEVWHFRAVKLLPLALRFLGR